MTKKIILKNDFHRSEAVVLLPISGWITPQQVKRAWKKLCGISGCTCCNELGQRGENDYFIDDREENGEKFCSLKLRHVDAEADGT